MRTFDLETMTSMKEIMICKYKVNHYLSKSIRNRIVIHKLIKMLIYLLISISPLLEDNRIFFVKDRICT